MPHRILELDFVRGVAIILVLFSHWIGPVESSSLLAALAEKLNTFGWAGVDLFFVLSGFLIGGLLFSEIEQNGALDVKRFLIRRGLKIYPMYYTYVAFEFVFRFCLRSEEIQKRIISHIGLFLPLFLNIQNYLPAPSAHLWSLAVEEHFYLALPLVLIVMLRTGSHRANLYPMLFGGVTLTCSILRILTWQNMPDYDPYRHAFPTHLNIDELAFGVLIAYYYYLDQRKLEFFKRNKELMLIVGIALVSPMMFIPRAHESGFVTMFGSNLLYLGFGGILLSLLYTRFDRVRNKAVSASIRTVSQIGIYSYAIYLVHDFMARKPVQALAEHVDLDAVGPDCKWLMAQSLYMTLAVIIGFLLTKFVEQPILVMRNRRFRARSQLRMT